jgi:hypothetical protein
MSLEEERARQAASAPSTSAAPALDTVAEGLATSTSPDIPSTPAPAAVKTEGVDDTAAVLAAAAASGGIEDVGMDAEGEGDDDLARALAMSRGDDVEMGDGDDDEDAEIARASELFLLTDILEGALSALKGSFSAEADLPLAPQLLSRCKSRRRTRKTSSWRCCKDTPLHSHFPFETATDCSHAIADAVMAARRFQRGRSKGVVVCRSADAGAYGVQKTKQKHVDGEQRAERVGGRAQARRLNAWTCGLSLLFPYTLGSFLHLDGGFGRERQWQGFVRSLQLG